MKNIFAINGVKTIIMIVALFFISAASLLAQSQNSQTSTLLEVQALRQEVAQLRDMVERQQYELRKMQRQLTSSTPQASVTAPIASQQQVSSIQQPEHILPGLTNAAGSDETLLNTPIADSNLATNVVNESSDAADLSSAVLTQTSVTSNEQTIQGEQKIPAPVISSTGDGVSATSVRGRVYPPVVEIDLGGSKAATKEQSNSGSLVANQTNTSLAVANIESVANEAAGTGEAKAVVLEPINTASQVLDIKPVETIGAKPVLSIPRSINTTESVAAVTPVVSEKAALKVISEKDYYQQGFDLLKESKHEEAVTIFKRQIQSYPKGSLADDAYYWIAESMYVNRKLDISKENFKAVIQGYPDSQRAPDAMLKLAYIEQEQGNIIEARILLQEIIQFHPKSDAALSAKNRLSEIN